MSWISTFTFLVLMVFAGGNAWAGQWAEACSGHGRKAQAECKAAEGILKAKDAARSALPGNNDIQNNAARLAANAAAQGADVAAAQGACKAAQTKCESQCEGEKGKAQPHAANKFSPLHQEAKLDISTMIDNAKKKDCTGPLKKEQDKLQQAKDNLNKDQNAANNTKDASNSGGAPQIPPIQPPQKEEKTPEEKQALNCEGDEGARYSDCNAKYIAKCMDRMNESGCETFAGRYCGNASGGNSVNLKAGENAHFKTHSANYVVDKSGEGLGSGFCKMVTAYRFCQAVGRTECPSCRGGALYSSAACQSDPSKCVPTLSSGQLADAKNKCPTDPIFLDPTVAKAVENGEGTKPGDKNEPSTPVINPDKTAGAPVAGNGSGGGGLGGGGGTGPIGAEGALNGATPESLPIGDANPVSAGGAAGSGSGNYAEESSEEEENRDPASAGGAAGILPAAAVEGLPARDVSNQFGPNLFSISSQVYRNMCAAEKFSTCANRK